MDGTSLDVGDWACTPSGAMARNPDDYPEPLKFNGFRFVEQQLLLDYGIPDYSQRRLQASRPSKFTDTHGNWQVWGTGRMTWYVCSF